MSRLEDSLSTDPELFALLESNLGHTEVADRINAELGETATTESSVRRARVRLSEAKLATGDSARNQSTFTPHDREVLHERLDTIIDQANISPSAVQGLRVSQWDGLIKDSDNKPVVTTLYGVNLNVRHMGSALVPKIPSLEELTLIRDYVPAAVAKIMPSKDPAGTFVVALGDLQTGKVNAEQGTDELWARVRATTQAVVDDLMSRPALPRRIILLHAGDCIEGYTSQGGRLIRKQDLYLTSQVDAYQRILEFQVLELAPLCQYLDVAVVPGNHDETTREFEVATEDSWAIFAARQAARYLKAAGNVPNVYWHYPAHDKLAVELEVSAVMSRPLFLAMVHGHKIASSANSIMDWWRKAAFGNQPGAKSRILITGHFHHFRSETAGDGRTWIQVPAMDGGSAWFANKRGDETPPGLVTFWIDPSKQYPICELNVHSEETE